MARSGLAEITRLRVFVLLVITLAAFAAELAAQDSLMEPEAPGVRNIYPGFSTGSTYSWSLPAGFQSTQPIHMEALGNEVAISFTLNWSPQQLIFLSAVPGRDLPAGCSLVTERSQLALGRVGISLNCPSTLREGTLRIVDLKWMASPGNFGSSGMSLSSIPTPIRVVDALGQDLPVVTSSATVLGLIADPYTVLAIGDVSAAGPNDVLIPIRYAEAFTLFQGQTSIHFSVGWDPEIFDFVIAGLGSGAMPGSVVEIDDSRLGSGRVGIKIRGTIPFPPTGGSRRVLDLILRPRPGVPPAGRYPVFFDDTPIAPAALNARDQPMIQGFAPIAGSIAYGAGVTVSGTVRSPAGQPLPNVRVALTGTTTRTATTSSFGTFLFNNVPVTQAAYVLNVGSKRYRFAPVSISPSGPVSVELRGLE
jgi:hypothetical protein